MKNENTNLFINIKKVWPYIKDSKLNLIGYIVESIIEAIIWVILPFFSAKIVLNITSGLIEQLILSAFFVFIIESLLYIGFFFKNLFYEKIYHKTLINFQMALAKETLKLEIKEIDRTSSGLFVDRLNNDTQEISRLFMLLLIQWVYFS